MRCWSSQQRSGWVYPTIVLCTFGFFTMMRPAEPFLTPFLIGSYKNLTIEQVSRQVYPVWTYTNLSSLIPVFLLTDIFRYKPVVVLQGLANILAWLLLLFGTGLKSVQSAFFSYGLALAMEVGYVSYIYSVVHKEHYQKVTSYSRGALLLGYAVGCLLGQILVSFGISLFCLNVITLSSLSISPFISLLLPMPQKNVLLNGLHSRSPSIDIFPNSSRVSSQCSFSTLMDATRRRIVNAVIVDFKECYSSVTLIFLSLWWAMGKCGFYQISSYVQILWTSKSPQNFTAYNGGVDALSTLSGAAASFAVGHVTLNWSVWGELVLGLFSAIAAGAVALMNLTSNIWICYACYMVFKSLYMLLTTICTFQIAKNLKTECYALMFGINSFVAVTLQTILTATVINTKSLRLPLTTQYYIYATFFATIAMIFLIRGVYTLLHLRQNLSDDRVSSDTYEYLI
ncbi:thiamine transporter 2-like [Conger conger]|uniref:thiamine transporter 2-like n=1 Tax=Conger conger TaxID=82655 RepID=UPI002A5AF7C5|nr:thiamine transporter 2-like [Conger conger]